MKGFPSWRVYQKSHDFHKLNKEQQIALKQQYNKLYFREYNKRRKAKKVSLSLTKKEYQQFVQAQKDYKSHSLNRLIIDMAKAYLDEGYIIPDAESNRKLIVAINRIGNLINQIVHKLHITSLRINKAGTIDLSIESLYRLLDAYEQIKKHLDQIQAQVNNYTSQPPIKLMEWSWEEIRDDAQKLDALLHFLLERREKMAKS